MSVPPPREGTHRTAPFPRPPFPARSRALLPRPGPSIPPPTREPPPPITPVSRGDVRTHGFPGSAHRARAAAAAATAPLPPGALTSGLVTGGARPRGGGSRAAPRGERRGPRGTGPAAGGGRYVPSRTRRLPPPTHPPTTASVGACAGVVARGRACSRGCAPCALTWVCARALTCVPVSERVRSCRLPLAGVLVCVFTWVLTCVFLRVPARTRVSPFRPCVSAGSRGFRCLCPARVCL